MTNKINRILDLAITIRHDDIASLLGYGRAGVPERVQEMVDDIEGVAPQLLEPACAYRIMKHEEFAKSRFLRHVDDVALCLVTIGGKLEEEILNSKEKGLLGHALILDTYGSAAAEACAEAAELIISSEVTGMGLRCSQRFSPGYGAWAVDEQRWIMDAIDGGSLGVTLTDGCMMQPRKSVTFAVTIGKNPIELRTANICNSCGAANCPSRDKPEKCFGRIMENDRE
jgi:hypothetical protein